MKMKKQLISNNPLFDLIKGLFSITFGILIGIISITIFFSLITPKNFLEIPYYLGEIILLFIWFFPPLIASLIISFILVKNRMSIIYGIITEILWILITLIFALQGMAEIMG